MDSVQVVNWFQEQSKDAATAVLAICQDVVSKKAAEVKPEKPAGVKRGRGPAKKNQTVPPGASDSKAQAGSLTLSA